MEREKAKAEMKAKEWAEKKAAGALDEDMPEDADGQLHNPDGSVFTGPKDAKKVSLINMVPPISKMDAKLNDLPKCEHLALSTNSIGAIGNLSALRELKILSLSRNNIKAISKLDGLGDTLQQLWMSYNSVEKLDGLSNLRKLRVFYVAQNNISDVKEFGKLAANKALEELTAVGNPCYEADPAATRAAIIRLVPTLKILDAKRITGEEREESESKQE